jgi:predicted DNA-binding ribbon-helix-helix protein
VNGAIRKRSVTIDGHATSVSLEETFWQALAALAADRKMSINALVSEIDRTRAPGAVNLSSAIRVFVLEQTQRRMSGEEMSVMTEASPPNAISS